MSQDTNKDFPYADQVTIIVRSADERTTDLCYKLIEEQGIKKKIYFSQEKHLFRQH